MRYIGAGAVATAGLITLIKSVPTIIESIRMGASKLQERISTAGSVEKRTQRDLPLKLVAGALLLLFLVMGNTSSLLEEVAR